MEKSFEKDWEDIDDGSSITDVLFEYVRYWRWFILSVLVCTIVGVFIILITQKEYKASLSVILNEEKSSSSSNSSSGLSFDGLSLLSTTSNIDNEIAIFLSPDLMGRVVDTLNLQSTYFTKGTFRETEIYAEAPFYVKYNAKRKPLTGKVDFYIEKTETGFNIKGTYVNKENQKYDIDNNVDKLPASIALPDSVGEIYIKLTGKDIKNSEKYYVLVNSHPSTVRSMISKLSVNPTSKGSSVLNINMICNNVEKGGVILRELVKQYNEMNVKVNNEMAFNTALFINERLKEIAIELGDVEKDVVDYKQKNRIADLSSEAQLFVQQTGQDQNRLMEVETQLNVISLVDKFVNDPANKLKIVPNLGISDPALAGIITEYNNKLLDSDALLKSTGEENPMRMRLTEEINNIRNSISNSLTNVKQAYLISKRDLQKTAGATRSRIQSIPQQEKGLIEKVRQQQIKESLFLFLMQKREETNMSIASTSDKARLISSPQSNIPPIAPKSNIILLASLILGFLIPIVVIYIINLLRTEIKDRNELEKLSKVSIVGQIGKNSSKDSIVIQKDEKATGLAEMFRSLRNNLNFILKNKDSRVILITSTISGEGKTFISVNLSLSYAITGKKVLLIGADIRNPKLKDYFNLQNNKGLTDYLVDEDNDWQGYINKSDLYDNLHIMKGGTVPPNPNELLMTPKLEDLLSLVKKDYDVVILDTAPVGLVSDTYLIDEFVDVTLYVTREMVTPKAAVTFINTQKKENRLRNMFLVLNDTALDSSYKYGYGKGYGYDKTK